MRPAAMALVVAILGAGLAGAQPANDDCSSAAVIGAVPFNDVLDVSAASSAAGDPDFDCDLGGAPGVPSSTVWYRYDAPSAVSLEIATLGSDYDTIVGVFRGTCGALTLAFCGDYPLDQNRPEGDDASLLVTLDAGESVYVVVADTERAGLPGTLVFDVRPTPLFVANGFEYTRYPMTAVAGGAAGDFLVVWATSDNPKEMVRGRLFDRHGRSKGPSFDIAAAGSTFRPSVAAAGTGDFVVVWGEYDFPHRVMARRVNASGTPLGTPFQVNVGSVYAYPSVAADAAGNFVVTWTNGSDEISAQRVDTADTGLGADVAVGTLPGFNPSVSMAPDGRFVVAWQDGAGLDGSSRGVVGRLFAADASSASGTFVVNTYTTGSQGEYGPDVAMTDGGDFVVTWQSGWDQNPGIDTIILVRRFDGTGAPLTGEFQVNTGAVTYGYTGSYGDDRNTFPAVAAAGTGEFVVSWRRAYSGPYGRKLDASGVPTGDEFQVGTFWTSYQAYYRTDVAATAGGDFAVVWDDLDFQEASAALGRAYAASGCPQAPASGCKQSVVDFKGKLKIKDEADDAKDLLVWKWVAGDAVTLGEIGNPATSDGFTLCLWDGGGAVPTDAEVVPGGTCDGKPCWKATKTGHLYKDKSGTAGGVQKLLVKAAAAGKSKLIVKAKGVALGTPPLPLALPATVQLHGDAGTCWTATFDTAGLQRNTADAFGGQAQATP